MRLVLDIGKKYPEITGPISDAFAAELNKVLATGDFQGLGLDCAGTKIISSRAMGALFQTKRKLKDQGKTMSVISASEKVTHRLRMVNMTDILM